MTFPRLTPLMRCVILLGSATIVGAGLAVAQSAPVSSQSSSDGFSSSNNSNLVQVAESVAPEGLAALPSAPTPAASAGGQEYGHGNGGWKQNLVDKYALEFSGGFNAPAGDKTYITWGGQFTVGGGYNFSKRLALLAEYQFIDDKIPGAIIARRAPPAAMRTSGL